MNRQFTPAPLVCPHCGCVIGEQAYFQSFEVKVATWLQGKVAPPATPGYDVYDSEPLPGKTFQVKYSQSFRYQPKNKPIVSVSWNWVVKRLDPVHPDFFILFGIDEDQVEHCFLYSRADLLKNAWQRGDGAITLRVSAKKRSDRKNYNYVPKIWRFAVDRPDLRLVDRIREYQSATQLSIFMEQWQSHADEIKALHDAGMSQKAIGDRFGVSSTTISRVLRNVRH